MRWRATRCRHPCRVLLTPRRASIVSVIRANIFWSETFVSIFLFLTLTDKEPMIIDWWHVHKHHGCGSGPSPPCVNQTHQPPHSVNAAQYTHTHTPLKCQCYTVSEPIYLCVCVCVSVMMMGYTSEISDWLNPHRFHLFQTQPSKSHYVVRVEIVCEETLLVLIGAWPPLTATIKVLFDHLICPGMARYQITISRQW